MLAHLKTLFVFVFGQTSDPNFLFVFIFGLKSTICPALAIKLKWRSRVTVLIIWCWALEVNLPTIGCVDQFNVSCVKSSCWCARPLVKGLRYLCEKKSMKSHHNYRLSLKHLCHQCCWLNINNYIGDHQ